jgi:hypothetical protein
MLIYHCDNCKEIWDYNKGGKLGILDHSVLCADCEKAHSPTPEASQETAEVSKKPTGEQPWE